jgi:hypothetical protein
VVFDVAGRLVFDLAAGRLVLDVGRCGVSREWGCCAAPSLTAVKAIEMYQLLSKQTQVA